MLIDNTRLIFGPERGYTTSIHNYFKNSKGNYHTTQAKEFFTRHNNERITDVNNDIYLEGYNIKNIYIDCSFTYFAEYIKNNTDIFFKNDILIYNLRNLNSFINSMYVTLFFNFLFRREFDHNLIMNSLLRIYDIASFIIRLRINKKYKGKVYFVNSDDFNITKILEYFNLEPPIFSSIKLPTLNDNLGIMNYLKTDKLNNENQYNIYQEKSHIIINMKRYINKYKKQINELNEKNIKALKKCDFILGAFDEEKFREQFNNDKITNDYVNKIINELPRE